MYPMTAGWQVQYESQDEAVCEEQNPGAWQRCYEEHRLMEVVSGSSSFTYPVAVAERGLCAVLRLHHWQLPDKSKNNKQKRKNWSIITC